MANSPSLPKNTWIDELNVVMFDKGYHAGKYGVELVFSGNECPSAEFAADVVDAVLSVRWGRHPWNKPVIRLRGLFHAKGAEDIRVLIRLFKSWGFEVHALLKDGTAAPWLDECNWSTVIIEKPRLILADAKEVWYMPLVKEKIPEPTLPEARTYELFLNKGFTKAETIEFITNASRPWRVL